MLDSVLQRPVMTRRRFNAVLAAWLATAGAAMAADGPQPQRVLYLGDPGRPRAVEFEKFLKRNFAAVRSADRHGFKAAQAGEFDVVLLDWPQNHAHEPFPPRECPLGDRAAWSKPTVLLGSAGLHVAIAWEAKGGAG